MRIRKDSIKKIYYLDIFQRTPKIEIINIFWYRKRIKTNFGERDCFVAQAKINGAVIKVFIDQESLIQRAEYKGVALILEKYHQPQ